MSDLAETVLPLVRTRSHLSNGTTVRAHGRKMHRAARILEKAYLDETVDAAEVFAVTQQALAASLKVSMRADDSSGIIGDAITKLVQLHPRAAFAAGAPPEKLAKWLIDFDFNDGNGGYFRGIDIVPYTPALGEQGLKLYRAKIEEIRAIPVVTDPAEPFTYDGTASGLRRVDCRLAVLDRDIEAIIATHTAYSASSSALIDTAKALEEIGEHDLAIDWARKAVGATDRSHFVLEAYKYLHEVAAQYRPELVEQISRDAFSALPIATTAAWLYDAVGQDWPDSRDEVMRRLARRPDELVHFALNTLHDPELAWSLAHENSLTSIYGWLELIDQYESIDPAACIPVLQSLTAAVLTRAAPSNYRDAADFLLQTRELARRTGDLRAVDAHIRKVREENRRRPKLLAEFNKARLP